MAQSVKSAPVEFMVRRCPPELIAPMEPTPCELKPLSNIDDQQGIRFQIPTIQFYRASDLKEGMAGRDPVNVIREALAKLLVFYYPFAGRLREELPSKKLFVDCTNEGIMFIEAEADITLEKYFDSAPVPPFPGIDEFLYDVPGSSGILDSPLVLIQVTRLLCGGFVLGTRVNHTMADAQGFVQFLTALTEIAKGATAPSTLPVWEREMLLERNPPRVTCTHRGYVEQAPSDINGLTMMPPLDDMILKSFFLGPRDMLALRRFVPENIGKCSTFEVLTASIWRCRTIAIKSKPDEQVGILFTIGARHQFNPPLPKGYYGNSFAWALADSTAAELHAKSLGHALERIKEVKNEVNEEYMRSLIDFMAIKGRPNLRFEGNYIISDVTRVGFQDFDFGWGKPVYAGPAISAVDVVSAGGTFLVPYTQKNGEAGIVVPICLPRDAMETFEKELDTMLN